MEPKLQECPERFLCKRIEHAANAVVATDDHTVKVYDSTLGQSTSMQSAAMLQSSHNQIMFSVENTQKQEGGTDCVSFAIAYATEFCYENATGA